MLRHLADKRSRGPLSGRLRRFVLIDRRDLSRLHPKIERLYRRARATEGSQRVSRFLTIERGYD